MKTSFILASAVAALSLTACDSAQEDARKKALESKADQLENQADATRKVGDAAANAQEKQGEANSTNTKAANETKADSLENKADAVRDAK